MTLPTGAGSFLASRRRMRRRRAGCSADWRRQLPCLTPAHAYAKGGVFCRLASAASLPHAGACVGEGRGVLPTGVGSFRDLNVETTTSNPRNPAIEYICSV
jgi:hypothetical protein